MALCLLASSPHSAVALECIPVSGQDGSSGRTAIPPFQFLFQPVTNLGKGLADKPLLEKILCQSQRMGSRKFW